MAGGESEVPSSAEPSPSDESPHCAGPTCARLTDFQVGGDAILGVRYGKVLILVSSLLIISLGRIGVAGHSKKLCGGNSMKKLTMRCHNMNIFLHRAGD